MTTQSPHVVPEELLGDTPGPVDDLAPSKTTLQDLLVAHSGSFVEELNRQAKAGEIPLVRAMRLLRLHAEATGRLAAELGTPPRFQRGLRGRLMARRAGWGTEDDYPDDDELLDEAYAAQGNTGETDPGPMNTERFLRELVESQRQPKLADLMRARRTTRNPAERAALQRQINERLGLPQGEE